MDVGGVLLQLSMDGHDYLSLAEDLHNAIALDFHYRHGKLFWSDVLLSAIMEANLDGTGSRGKFSVFRVEII